MNSVKDRRTSTTATHLPRQPGTPGREQAEAQSPPLIEVPIGRRETTEPAPITAAIESATRTQARPTPQPHPRKILVADDESLAAAAVMQALRQLGYTVVGPARDGEHAIELTFSTLPDLAVLDVRMMTDSDGIDAARAMFHELLIPVVIISAYSDREQVALASAAGVFGYLVKPVTREQLRPAIEVAWARFNQYLEKEIEAETLRRKLEDRQLIEQAKWFLVERDSLIESEAMRLLRHMARDSGRDVATVARELLSR